MVLTQIVRLIVGLCCLARLVCNGMGAEGVYPGAVDLRFDAGTPLVSADGKLLEDPWRVLKLVDDSLIAINSGTLFKIDRDGKADKLFSLRTPPGPQICATNWRGDL